MTTLTVHMVQGLVIRPDDTVIVQVDRRHFDTDEAVQKFVEELQNELHYLLPDVRGVVLVVPGQIAVQRAPELDDPARPLVDLAPLPESVPFDFGPVGEEIDDFLADPSIGQVRERPRARFERGTDGPGGST